MIRTVDDLPDVAGFTRGDYRSYGEPELGWSAPYAATEARCVATVFVYPVPSRAQTTDMTTVLEEEFRSVNADMQQFALMSSVEASVLSSSPARTDPTLLGGGTMLRSYVLRGSGPGQVMYTDVVLSTTGEQFLKVRCTYDVMDPRGCGQHLNRLLSGLATVR